MNRITFGKTIGGRSAAFDAWLREQSPERQAEIAAAEQAYVESVDNTPLERDVADSMEGYEDTPAGPGKHSDFASRMPRLRSA